MSGLLYSVTYLVTFSAAFVGVALAIGNLIGTIFQVRPEHNTMSTLLAPLVPLLPNRMFTDAGARCRRRFWLSLLAAACCVGVLILLEQTFGKPPYMQALEQQSNTYEAP